MSTKLQFLQPQHEEGRKRNKYHESQLASRGHHCGCGRARLVVLHGGRRRRVGGFLHVCSAVWRRRALLQLRLCPVLQLAGAWGLRGWRSGRGETSLKCKDLLLSCMVVVYIHLNGQLTITQKSMLLRIKILLFQNSIDTHFYIKLREYLLHGLVEQAPLFLLGDLNIL